MAADRRDLLAVLKNELAFLEKGGYRETARAAWRPQFIFQDSPTCLNFDPEQQPRPCNECILMQLVPHDFRKRHIPCRYIPIGDQGRTIEWYYRSGTPEELEAALREWLTTQVDEIEREKAKPLNPEGPREIHVQSHFLKNV